MTKRLIAPEGGCVVRMYRHGLGDCFLLAFGLGDGEQRYMLIDCGVLSGTEDPTGAMTEVARNIGEATGEHLHAAVVTHEHWDHVSGFHQAASEFDELACDELWMAWTEAPQDQVATQLRDRKERAVHTICL